LNPSTLSTRVNPAASGVGQCQAFRFGQHGTGFISGHAIPEPRNMGVRDGDQPCPLAGIAAGRCFGEQRVHGLGRVSALVEPRPVHGLDLPFFHPHRV
jgi:hypothetical protein